MPIVQIADVPNVLVVNPDVPAKTLEAFIAYAKANPGKLNYGSTGVGTSSHLSSFMLSKQIGAQTTHVPYKGANALTDLLGGRIELHVRDIPSVIAHIKAGKLRPLAVSSAKRSRSMPRCRPSPRRASPASRPARDSAIGAPKGTPAEVIALVNKVGERRPLRHCPRSRRR